LLLVASDGDDRVSTRTANIDLTPAALKCDFELGWPTALGFSRFLRVCIPHDVNATHINGVHCTAGIATLELRRSARSGLTRRPLWWQLASGATTTIGPAAPECLPANDDARPTNKDKSL
jgi:hypothetical protein